MTSNRNLSQSKDEFWETNAEQWNQVIEAGTFKNREFTNAALLNEVKKLNCSSVLDIGCGEGWLAGHLDLKNIKYYGIDGSAGLVEIAKNKHKAPFEQVTYSAIQTGAWKPAIQYDCVVFNFSLLDEEISNLLKSSSQFLQSKGFLIIQTLHPCFTLQEYKDGWNTEDFKSSDVDFKGEMPWFGRTLGTWIQIFKKCQLNLHKVIEPIGKNQLPASIIFVLQRGDQST